MCEWTRHTLKICYGHSLFYFSQYVDYKKQKKKQKLNDTALRIK